MAIYTILMYNTFCLPDAIMWQNILHTEISTDEGIKQCEEPYVPAEVWNRSIED